MEAEELISKIEADLSAVQKDGHGQLEIKNLLKYFGELRNVVGPSREGMRQAHEVNLTNFKVQSDHSLEMFRAVMDAGKEAINSAIIINGGAVIALLAFLGNAISDKAVRPQLAGLAEPLFTFAIGVLCGSVAFGCRYIAQFFYFDERTKTYGHAFNALSWLTTFGAVAAFAFGALETYQHVGSAFSR
jgi:hypothetical protein